MNHKENIEEDVELSFDERFKLIVERWRPYLLRLWDARWKFVKINAVVFTLTLAYLLFLTHPYYKSTDKV